MYILDTDIVADEVYDLSLPPVIQEPLGIVGHGVRQAFGLHGHSLTVPLFCPGVFEKAQASGIVQPRQIGLIPTFQRLFEVAVQRGCVLQPT
jgi:hypothetical protein